MKKIEMSQLNQTKIDLRNKNSMYENAKEKVILLQKEIKNLKEENTQYLQIIDSQKEDIERMQYTIDEYSRMIFKKRKKISQDSHSFNQNETSDNENIHKNTNNKREKESYKRKIPSFDKISHTIETPIIQCPSCLHPLTNIKKIERYVEDISFKEVKPKVTKYILHSWFCSVCKKQKSLKDIPKWVVMFWDNIRMFVNFSITVLKLSYDAVKSILKTLYSFEISDGEIRNILETEAKILTPEYNRIKWDIQKQFWVNFDETWWQVRSNDEKSYAWCMTWIENPDTIFDLWISRGGGEIDILGWVEENKLHIWISDWYPWYTNKFGIHQLCWAHPHRKLRDLTESKLEEKKLERCRITHKEFAKLYGKVREEIKKEKEKSTSEESRKKLKNKLLKIFEKITKIHKDDPKKLITYKESLWKYKDKYFVCILYPWIPADNNKAERCLRHLVLKRKMCHWSQTKESAAFMSINYSVLLSRFWRHPDDFFWDYEYLRKLYFENFSPHEEKKELKI